jgi:hypothetical protein
MVLDRTAWKRHRDTFAQLSGFLKLYSIVSCLMMLVVEEQLLDEEYDTTFSMVCFNLSGSVAACANKNHFTKAASLIEAFLSKEMMVATTPLSKKDVIVYCCKLAVYIQTLSPL